MTLIDRSFYPARWLPGPHAQTLGARMLRPKETVRLERERWDTPDGDFLDLDFANVPEARDDALVLLLHGLEGSSMSGYAYQLYKQLGERRLAAVGLNFRSCSGELNRGLRLYHSGETTDAAWVIGRLRERFPERRLAAVGISLGGNVLLKLLGEQGGAALLNAAASWSAPFDLGAGATFMEEGFARNYVFRLLRSLKRKVRARREDIGHLIDVEETLASRTFRDFDNSATAPLHGFDDADDYYARSSCRQYISGIRTPTLVVHARDDPFLPAAAVPEAVLASNRFIDAVITDHGGHVGHVAGKGLLRPDFWAESTIAEWLSRKLD